MSKPYKTTPLNHQADSFQSQQFSELCTYPSDHAHLAYLTLLHAALLPADLTRMAAVGLVVEYRTHNSMVDSTKVLCPLFDLDTGW